MAEDITVRFAVRDAEVVRAALERFGREGQGALDRVNAAAAAPSRGLGTVSTLMQDLQGRAAGMSQALGPAGTLLRALGPIGLGVAAGLGAAALALRGMVGAANRLAGEAARIREFGENVGLSAEQIQVLGIAGARTGVEFDKIKTSIDRFTVSLEELRRGQGQALEQIQRINPALAEELARTRDTAAAIDVLARAWARADIAQRNALARAVFGGSGIDMGRVLAQVAGAGGLGPLAAELQPSVVLTQQQVERFEELKNKIEETRKRARDLSASMFTEEMLQRQLQWAELMERGALALKRMEESGERGWWRRMWDFLGERARELQRGHRDFDPFFDFEGGRLGARGLTREALINWWQRDWNRRAGIPEEGAPLPPPRPREAPGGELSAEFRFHRMREWVALLGAAATPTEQLRLKELELAAATEKNATLRGAAARALDAYRLALEQTAAATRQRLGIVGEEEMAAVRLRELDDLRAKGYVRNAEEMAAAERLIRREVRETMEALRVRAAETPALTRLALDADNLTRQLDTGLAGALQGATSELVAMARGTQTLGQGLSNLAARFADAIGQALIMRTVIGPLANLISGGLGGLFGGAAAAPAALAGITNVGGLSLAGAQWALVGHGGGMVEELHRLRLVPAHAFFGAPRLHGGLLPGERAAILRRDEAVLTPGQMRALGSAAPRVQITVNNHAGAEVSAQSRDDGRGGLDVTLTIEKIVEKSLAAGRLDAALGARFGARAQSRRR